MTVNECNRHDAHIYGEKKKERLEEKMVFRFIHKEGTNCGSYRHRKSRTFQDLNKK